MKWARKKIGESGYYWYRASIEHCWWQGIIKIYRPATVGLLKSNLTVSGCHWTDDLLELTSDLDADWAGPITEPEE